MTEKEGLGFLDTVSYNFPIYFSFVHSFRQMSLWSVPDQETLELMKLFYSKWLAGTEKHEALKQAQLEMRERVRRSHGHDPSYYWGAFVLLGR